MNLKIIIDVICLLFFLIFSSSSSAADSDATYRISCNSTHHSIVINEDNDSSSSHSVFVSPSSFIEISNATSCTHILIDSPPFQPRGIIFADLIFGASTPSPIAKLTNITIRNVTGSAIDLSPVVQFSKSIFGVPYIELTQLRKSEEISNSDALNTSSLAAASSNNNIRIVEHLSTVSQVDQYIVSNCDISLLRYSKRLATLTARIITFHAGVSVVGHLSLESNSINLSGLRGVDGRLTVEVLSLLPFANFFAVRNITLNACEVSLNDFQTSSSDDDDRVAAAAATHSIAILSSAARMQASEKIVISKSQIFFFASKFVSSEGELSACDASAASDQSCFVGITLLRETVGFTISIENDQENGITLRENKVRNWGVEYKNATHIGFYMAVFLQPISFQHESGGAIRFLDNRFLFYETKIYLKSHLRASAPLFELVTCKFENTVVGATSIEFSRNLMILGDSFLPFSISVTNASSGTPPNNVTNIDNPHLAAPIYFKHLSLGSDASINVSSSAGMTTKNFSLLMGSNSIHFTEATIDQQSISMIEMAMFDCFESQNAVNNPLYCITGDGRTKNESSSSLSSVNLLVWHSNQILLTGETTLTSSSAVFINAGAQATFAVGVLSSSSASALTRIEFSNQRILVDETSTVVILKNGDGSSLDSGVSFVAASSGRPKRKMIDDPHFHVRRSDDFTQMLVINISGCGVHVRGPISHSSSSSDDNDNNINFVFSRIGLIRVTQSHPAPSSSSNTISAVTATLINAQENNNTISSISGNNQRIGHQIMNILPEVDSVSIQVHRNLLELNSVSESDYIFSFAFASVGSYGLFENINMSITSNRMILFNVTTKLISSRYFCDMSSFKSGQAPIDIQGNVETHRNFVNISRVHVTESGFPFYGVWFRSLPPSSSVFGIFGASHNSIHVDNVTCNGVFSMYVFLFYEQDLRVLRDGFLLRENFIEAKNIRALLCTSCRIQISPLAFTGKHQVVIGPILLDGNVIVGQNWMAESQSEILVFIFKPVSSNASSPLEIKGISILNSVVRMKETVSLKSVIAPTTLSMFIPYLDEVFSSRPLLFVNNSIVCSFCRGYAMVNAPVQRVGMTAVGINGALRFGSSSSPFSSSSSFSSLTSSLILVQNNSLVLEDDFTLQVGRAVMRILSITSFTVASSLSSGSFNNVKIFSSVERNSISMRNKTISPSFKLATQHHFKTPTVLLALLYSLLNQIVPFAPSAATSHQIAIRVHDNFIGYNENLVHSSSEDYDHQQEPIQAAMSVYFLQIQHTWNLDNGGDIVISKNTFQTGFVANTSVQLISLLNTFYTMVYGAAFNRRILISENYQQKIEKMMMNNNSSSTSSSPSSFDFDQYTPEINILRIISAVQFFSFFSSSSSDENAGLIQITKNNIPDLVFPLSFMNISHEVAVSFDDPDLLQLYLRIVSSQMKRIWSTLPGSMNISWKFGCAKNGDGNSWNPNVTQIFFDAVPNVTSFTSSECYNTSLNEEATGSKTISSSRTTNITDETVSPSSSHSSSLSATSNHSNSRERDYEESASSSKTSSSNESLSTSSDLTPSDTLNDRRQDEPNDSNNSSSVSLSRSNGLLPPHKLIKTSTSSQSYLEFFASSAPLETVLQSSSKAVRSTTVSAAAVVAKSGISALSLQRTALIGSLLRKCSSRSSSSVPEDTDDDENTQPSSTMDFISSPTQLKILSSVEPRLSIFSGAVVGNLAVCVGYALLMYTITFITKFVSYHGKSWDFATKQTSLYGRICLPFILLAAGSSQGIGAIIAAAAVRQNYNVTVNHLLIAGVGIALLLLPISHRSISIAVQMMLPAKYSSSAICCSEHTASNNKNDDESPGECSDIIHQEILPRFLRKGVPKWRKLFKKYFEGEDEWLETDLVSKYFIIIDGTRKLQILPVDVIISILCGLVIGFADFLPPSTFCLPSVVVLMVFSVLHFLLLVMMSPVFFSPFDQLFSLLLSGLTGVASILALVLVVVVGNKNDESGINSLSLLSTLSKILEYVELVQAIVAGIMTVFLLIAASVDLFDWIIYERKDHARQRYKLKHRMKREGKQVNFSEFEENQNTNFSGGSDGEQELVTAVNLRQLEESQDDEEADEESSELRINNNSFPATRRQERRKRRGARNNTDYSDDENHLSLLSENDEPLLLESTSSPRSRRRSKAATTLATTPRRHLRRNLSQVQEEQQQQFDDENFDEPQQQQQTTSTSFSSYITNNKNLLESVPTIDRNFI